PKETDDASRMRQPPVRSSPFNSRKRRDLPTPGSPTTPTTWPWPRLASSRFSFRWSISRERPMKGVRPRRAPAWSRVLTSEAPSVLVGDRCAEEGHDPVAQDVVHCALVAVDRVHHQLDRGVHEPPCFFRINALQQFHRAAQVGEERRDLLSLALE